MLNVFTQRQRVDVTVAIRRIVEFDGRNLGRELATADEVEIVTLRIPYRIPRVEIFIGHAVQLVLGGAPDINMRHPAFGGGHAEREKGAARRPGIIANLTTR